MSSFTIDKIFEICTFFEKTTQNLHFFENRIEIYTSFENRFEICSEILDSERSSVDELAMRLEKVLSGLTGSRLLKGEPTMEKLLLAGRVLSTPGSFSTLGSAPLGSVG